jgi:hypothetical protein
MKPIRIFSPSHLAIISASLISMFLLSSATLESQTPINFSGKWEYDKDKSSPGTNDAEYNGTIVRQITQTASTIACRDIYIQKGSNDYTTSDDVFNLNGKEEIDKSDPNSILTKSVIWSQDHKSLTLSYKSTYIEEGVSKEFIINETYKLSDDGKTLMIEKYSKDAVRGEIKTKNIYHKK